MGTLDSIAGVMQSFGTAYLSSQGALVVLLMQSAIPISMIITKAFLKTKYRVYQYIGACIVVAGILVVLIPQLVGQSGGDASATGKWAAVLILSCEWWCNRPPPARPPVVRCARLLRRARPPAHSPPLPPACSCLPACAGIPMCLSSVYKEKALGDTEIDAIYMNYWVAVYQFLVSFPLLIPMGYASSPVVKITDLPTNLWNGMRCYAGYNSITVADPSSGAQVDNCTMGPVFVNIYILFNVSWRRPSS